MILVEMENNLSLKLSIRSFSIYDYSQVICHLGELLTNKLNN